MVVSMSVICLMLFMTITILSSALALKNTMEKELAEMTPVDLNLYKTANLPESYIKYGKEVKTTPQQRADSKVPISDTLKKQGLDMSVLKDVTEVVTYKDENLTNAKFFGDTLDKVKSQFGMLNYEIPEELVKVSDYNKIARLYGINQYELKDDEYIVLCDFDSMTNIRNEALADGKNDLRIAGKVYKSKYNECKEGYLVMSTSHTNTGTIIVPDSCNLTDEMKAKHLLVANYNAETDEEKEEIETLFVDREAKFVQNVALEELEMEKIDIDGYTKISLTEASLGLATIVTFIAIYLGIIFVIASSAILALKQLTDSSDNKDRYMILRKIGADEKMINRALFRQIGIFFILPLILAVIHSVFGIQFALMTMEGIADKATLIPSIIGAMISIGVIYGLYFLATYIGSKNIIKEDFEK